MKLNRSYIFSIIAAEMITIPTFLTIGLIFMSVGHVKVFTSSLETQLGASGMMFLYILFTVLVALIIGGVAGFIYSKHHKEKPSSAVVRYMAPLIPVVYALFFACLAWIFSKGNYNSSWWAVYAFKNPMFFIFNFAMAFSGLHFLIPFAEICGYLGFGAGILLHEQISKTFFKDKAARNLKLVFMSIFIVSIVITCIGTRDIINNGFLELRYGKSQLANESAEFGLGTIAPFRENNGLAKLDKKASLQFTALENMPRLDGATAAYPVYAAFVQAVYKGLGDCYGLNRGNLEVGISDAFVSSEDYPLNIVKCSTTAYAYENLINKQTDIIFVAEPSKSQINAVKASGDAFVLTPIGNEAFVFFTNVKNPVHNITMKQIQDIYSGKITNWKEVGGNNKSILPYQRPEDSGSQTIMRNKVMKGIEMINPTKETFAGGMGDMISRVASYKNAKNAIGYSFMYYTSSMIKNKQIKYIAINGIMPSSEAVRSRKYPFTIPVYAVTLKSNTNKNVQRLIDWILTDEGQSLVEKTGYVPVK